MMASSQSNRLLFVTDMFLMPALICLVPFIAQAEQLDLSVASVRTEFANRLASERHAARTQARVWADTNAAPIEFDTHEASYELMAVANGRPLYYKTYNLHAAISTAVDVLREPSPYHMGVNLIIGLWDRGLPLPLHEQFRTGLGYFSRVVCHDGAETHWHATHVACTIGGSGEGNSFAQGMAPGVRIAAYGWDDDVAELAQRAAARPGEADKIYISNHSYGATCGWDRQDDHYYWYGAWAEASSVEDLFGRYTDWSEQIDRVAYQAPYCLVFCAVGNDRQDNPTAGQSVFYSLDGGLTWNETSYDRGTCPPGDGEANEGYGTVNPLACAKNVMAVGAVADAVSSWGTPTRSLDEAAMTSFSVWGPTDDGRIKPDIVANGYLLTSASDESESSYLSASGTSSACANASGSAIILVDCYDTHFPGQAMPSSTLKGLIIHTADDLGNPGPDYQYGWGLMNTDAAADLIKRQSERPGGSYLLEETLHQAQARHEFRIASYGWAPLRLTLCWTDPPGQAADEHDEANPRLVNDLDLRVTAPDGSVLEPFVLDRTHPSVPATTGDNTVDTVEQIHIELPQAGPYSVTVSHKGHLADEVQSYCLISSIPVDPAPLADDALPWIRQIGTSQPEHASSVCTGPLGYVYMTGITGGSLFRDNIGGSDIFVSKYDMLGNAMWAIQTGTVSADEPSCICTDDLGYVYVAGSTDGTFGWPDLNGRDAVLVKYDPWGNRLWTRQFGTNSDDFATAICADPAGYLYVLGSTGWGDERDLFLSKYDSAGNELWTRPRGTSEYDSATGVSTDDVDRVYTTGVTEGSLEGLNRGQADIFLSRHDSLGNVLWTKQVGSPDYDDRSAGVCTDGFGHVYIAGYTVNVRGSFVSKYDASGKRLWTRQIDGPDRRFGFACNGIAANQQGYVYVTGNCGGDTFTTALDRNGNLFWRGQPLGTDNSERANAIAVDAYGRVYITGNTSGSFDGFSQAGIEDAFLIRLDTPTPPIPAPSHGR